MGKLIVVEGTDCSGKETQTKKLVERLNEDGFKTIRLGYPMYDTPTGKIICACLLGKPQMCEELLKQDHGFFKEGGGNVDPLTAILLYAADRRYNLPKIYEALDSYDVVILDRYVPSNMAHRGGQILDEEKRHKMYEMIENLEYEILEEPKPDMTVFLYMPYEWACELKKNRDEKPDEVETSEEYLRQGEKTFLELEKLYDYTRINCVEDNKLKTIDDISDEVYVKVTKFLNSTKKTLK